MKYFLRPITVFILAGLIALIFSSCGKNSKDEDITVGVVLKLLSNAYFQDIEKGIRETAEIEGVKLFMVTREQRDPEAQLQLLENMLKLKLDALMFTPEGDKRSIPVIIEANQKKIPVIILVTGIDEEEARARGAHFECYIAGNNEQGGELAAEYLSGKLNGKGTVLVIPGDPGSFSGERRIKGFSSGMKNHQAIKVITSPPAHYSRSQAFKVCKQIFVKNKEIKGVFAANEAMAIGASDALAVLKMKNVCIIGFDATEMGLKAVKEGRMDATIAQNPYKIGKIAIESVIRIKKGEKLPPVILTESELITREKLHLPFQ